MKRPRRIRSLEGYRTHEVWMRGTGAIPILLIAAAPAAAQVAAPVERIRVQPDSLVVEMGDTAVFSGAPVDSAGNVVTGAVWGATDGPVFELEAVAASDSSQAFRLWGSEVGQGTIGLFVAHVEEGGQPRWRRVGGVPVTVLDYPVARVEAPTLPYAPYAGPRFRPIARVINARDVQHAPASVSWSTSDSTVARFDGDGLLELIRAGSVRLVASADTAHTIMDVVVLSNPVDRITLALPSDPIRTGDVVHLDPSALAAGGRPVPDVALTYRVERIDGEPGVGASAGSEPGAAVLEDGAFVARRPGRYRVEALAGQARGGLELDVFPRDVEQSASFVAHVPTPRATDLWVFEGLDGRDYAYIGTISSARMYAIDVTDPTRPFVTDSVTADGRRVNDVKINDDRTLAIITSENAANRRNGITLLDITQPAHPRVITHYTENLTGGVHNVSFVGDLVYAVNDGTLDVHIIDISDPARPLEVGRWGLERRGRYLHDVSVLDGLAYLSYWDDGVVILDVGAGIEGGTPTEPVFVSSLKYRYEINGELYGNTHHALRYRNYVFLTDEIFGCPGCRGPRGYVHVVDVSDIREPREVAYYRLPDAGSHNMWVEDDRLYVAYYQGGVRVVDVSGELRGDLRAQGREIAAFHTNIEDLAPATAEAPPSSEEQTEPSPTTPSVEPEGPLPPEPSAVQLPPGLAAGGTLSWGPQPYKGHLFVSDMNSGLWIIRLEPRPVIP
jgi:hypothetical protein